MITDAADPVITAIGSVTVKESDLNGGGGRHVGSSPSGTRGDRRRSVTIAAGSDRVAALQLDVARFNALNTLTSGGKAVTIGADSQPGVYLARTAQASSSSSSLDVSGRYTFELTGNLDHSVQGKGSAGYPAAAAGPGQHRARAPGDQPTSACRTCAGGRRCRQDPGRGEERRVAICWPPPAKGGRCGGEIGDHQWHRHPIAASGNTRTVTDSTGQSDRHPGDQCRGQLQFHRQSGIDHATAPWYSRSPSTWWMATEIPTTVFDPDHPGRGGQSSP